MVRFSLRQAKWFVSHYNLNMNNKFGDILRELRKEKGLTQAQLGSLVNVAGPTIRGWENYHREPNIDTICKLAKIFDVTVGQLLGVEEY